MEQNMSQFDKVSVVREANIYFDGKVTSRTILFADGSKKTLGVMLPGEYEFGTDEAELMEILSGEMKFVYRARIGAALKAAKVLKCRNSQSLP